MALFSVGDPVKLRSAGPPMTVTEAEVTVDGRIHVRCRWFYGGHQGDEVLPEYCLTVADAWVHRHLIGVESPPHDYVLDNATIGPDLRDGWEVETWVLRGSDGPYWLRAWNKGTGRFAITISRTYMEAADNLREDVSRGGSRKAELD
jgi:uncharacterized protein YodC (DUF2158 family)